MPQPPISESRVLISESRVREIHNTEDLRPFSRLELQQADAWIKDYALRKLSLILTAERPTIARFVEMMVRAHYGTVEIDDFLTTLRCYPDFLLPPSSSPEA